MNEKEILSISKARGCYEQSCNRLTGLFDVRRGKMMKTWNDFNSEVEFGDEFLPSQQFGEATANDYWQRFAKSGSISDYLNYTAYARGERKLDDIK